MTDPGLAGTTAAGYGFDLTRTGARSASVDVGGAGAAVGASNDSVLTVLNILRATDQLSAGGNGTLYGGSAELRGLSTGLYAVIIRAGGI